MHGRQHALVRGHREIKPEWSYRPPPCYSLYREADGARRSCWGKIVTNGLTQLCYTINLAGKMCLLVQW